MGKAKSAQAGLDIQDILLTKLYNESLVRHRMSSHCVKPAELCYTLARACF